jgi:hypothetical protein
VLGALEVTTGQWVYRLGRRRASDFAALLDQLLRAFPRAPAIAVICGNDSIHHARAVTAWLERHPRLELLHGARYSPHGNPVERIWGGLKNYVANTAVTWPGRLRQVHAFFRARSPAQLLAAAAPWTSPWLPPGYEQNFWNAAYQMTKANCRLRPVVARSCIWRKQGHGWPSPRWQPTSAWPPGSPPGSRARPPTSTFLTISTSRWPCSAPGDPVEALDRNVFRIIAVW